MRKIGWVEFKVVYLGWFPHLKSRSSAAAPCFSPALHLGDILALHQTDEKDEKETNQLLRLAEKVTGMSRAGGMGRCRDELEPAIELSWMIKNEEDGEVGEGLYDDEFNGWNISLRFGSDCFELRGTY